MSSRSLKGKGGDLYVADYSDIHLGHPEVTASELIANLNASLPDNAETAKLNIIFISGDVFDKLLTLPHEYAFDIKAWIKRWLVLAKKHDILIRVLKGTPLHDRDQSTLFESMNALLEIGADLKYVRELSIEYIERYGISVLYVPDEWGEPDNTLSQVKDLLRAKGLAQVDYAVMHGLFDFQLPAVSKSAKHDSAEYLKLVKKIIFIGHDHTFKRHERIIVPGSFGRLTQGQEEPKGHVRVLDKKNGELDIEFIENTGAKKFVTLDCTGMSVEQILQKVDQAALTLPNDSHVRITAEASNPIFANMETLIRRYPLLNWKKNPKEGNDKEEVYEAEEEDFTPISLTKENLTDLLMRRVASRSPSKEVLDAARSKLEEVL